MGKGKGRQFVIELTVFVYVIANSRGVNGWKKEWGGREKDWMRFPN